MDPTTKRVAIVGAGISGPGDVQARARQGLPAGGVRGRRGPRRRVEAHAGLHAAADAGAQLPVLGLPLAAGCVHRRRVVPAPRPGGGLPRRLRAPLSASWSASGSAARCSAPSTPGRRRSRSPRGSGGRATARAFGDGTGEWLLTVQHRGSEATQGQFDFLILCLGKFSGVANTPAFPPNRGPEVFRGQVLHSMDYSRMAAAAAAELIRGKRVASGGLRQVGLRHGRGVRRP
ncbi:hypothetical protein PVAP13_7NG402501 [Panicum virgatum]|uniref:Flavin-containing monooxygenase n=1 Tax=Panicum virgatum TaxID=38727 RepID=A0A8T0Q7L4_PANVG|nr:hypothetical protein PVAP13_7NG402501 [Panicum virgatum]